MSITGYGTRAQSTTSGLYDSNMAKVPSDALIQVKIVLGALLNLSDARESEFDETRETRSRLETGN